MVAMVQKQLNVITLHCMPYTLWIFMDA